jgi:hypothetical protein
MKKVQFFLTKLITKTYCSDSYLLCLDFSCEIVVNSQIEKEISEKQIISKFMINDQVISKLMINNQEKNQKIEGEIVQYNIIYYQ